ncbi:MAG: glutamate--tRNA ligase [Candidatus Paceibacterota bacterium]|jgi:glutamyl-tRNA synthetase
MNVRVRFAPSPTGFLHFGGVRTALFNWLFARHEGGKFLLRIEDTDKERSEKRFEDDIIKGLEWLGITWDEPIVRQSDRISVYETQLKKLINERRAYYCFCTPEEIEEEYQAQLVQGLIPKYGGRCRTIPHEEAEKRAHTSPHVIRFRMTEKIVSFTDMIRGKVEFNTKLFGDVIIAKGLREPLYNFAVVIDDAEMKISHVIRGEEHLSNTPKQIIFSEALGLPVPTFAHLPLILGHDKKKLSKRFLTTSLDDYQTQGYLPSAIINFLALLGWHPSEDREVLTLGELVSEFTIKRVQKAGAIYNPEKLEWLNAMHIRAMDTSTLMEHLVPFTPAPWRENAKLFEQAVILTKERLKNLSEFQATAHFFFELPDYPQSLLVWKGSTREAARENLNAIQELLQNADTKKESKSEIEMHIMKLAEKRGRGEILWPLRVSLSGKEASPGPLELLNALGCDEAMLRIAHAIQKLNL